MAYHFDNYDNALVIDGFEGGIADSPHAGISDMRNVNIISVPGEATVNFSTQSIASPSVTANVTSVSSNTVTVDTPGSLESGMAIIFSNVASYTGLSAGTSYWVVKVSGNTFNVFSDELLSTQVLITGTGTAPFTAPTMAKPKHFATSGGGGAGSPGSTSVNFMIDASGRVWSDRAVTTSGYWTFTGNTGHLGADAQNGNGLVYYSASDGTGYLFAFSDAQIDYVKDVSAFTWVYGWNPANASTGNTTNYLKSGANSGNSHEAFVAPDSRVYFCDANWIGRFYQTSPSTAFDPTSVSTFTFDQTALLPTTDIANCISFLGTNILVGGIRNIVYPWDRFDTNFSYPILLPEYGVTKIVTVNTNSYIFAGNRGRIYITNGAQVELFKKVPDHISGTVEPYFTWGGAVSIKNQLYFGVSATDNAGTAITQYGGVWAIDLDTKTIRLTQKLSYATYAGLATALLAQIPPAGAISQTQKGAGLFIGWQDGAGGFGADKTISTPYTGSQAIIDSDLIPIGTFNKPRDNTRIEFKLSKPLVSGESIQLQYRLDFSQSYTTIFTDSTVGDFDGDSAVNFKNAKWLQIRAVLNSTASSPSYVRLKNIRILGFVGPTVANSQNLSVA